MNLYKILCGHFGPKDSHTSIECLLLATDDRAVYNWIASQDNSKEEHAPKYNSWADREEDDDDFKSKMISIKGELFDEDRDFSDAYYGVTLYGWELIKGNIDSVAHDMLTHLPGILFTAP